MKNRNLVLAAFVIVKFILQYVAIHPDYDLHRDEYLHLDQGRHLAWGYISVPPVTSWISCIINFLGNSVICIKFFPALFGALTIVLVWKIIEELKGGWFALLLGSSAVLLSVLLRINSLFQPNSLDIFSWTLLFYILVKYINSGNAKWLIVSGAAIGFGLLSKYNIFFLVTGLLVALLFSRHRRVIRERNLYIGIALAFIIVLPNLLWQIRNDFPTLHQLKELNDTQLVNVNRFDFMKEQLFFFLNSLFVILAAFIALIVYKPFEKFRVFLLVYIITLFVFLFLKAKGYYAIGLYPVFLAFGSVYLEFLFSSGWKIYLKPVSLLVVILFSIPLFTIALPMRSPEHIQQKSREFREMGLLRWEDGKEHEMPQDFADMLGWSELALIADSVYRNVNKEHTLVLCDNYGEAGAINYYSDFRDINAVSFNTDYINWIPLNKKIENVIYIKEADDVERELRVTGRFFKSYRIYGSIQNKLAREYRTSVLLFKDAVTDINAMIAAEILERKKH